MTNKTVRSSAKIDASDFRMTFLSKTNIRPVGIGPMPIARPMKGIQAMCQRHEARFSAGAPVDWELKVLQVLHRVRAERARYRVGSRPVAKLDEFLGHPGA
jgi:hypothetical protein